MPLASVGHFQLRPFLRLCCSHNMELALEWLESQRAVMYNPATAGYFLQFTDGKGNKHGKICECRALVCCAKERLMMIPVLDVSQRALSCALCCRQRAHFVWRSGMYVGPTSLYLHTAR